MDPYALKVLLGKPHVDGIRLALERLGSDRSRQITRLDSVLVV